MCVCLVRNFLHVLTLNPRGVKDGVENHFFFIGKSWCVRLTKACAASWIYENFFTSLPSLTVLVYSLEQQNSVSICPSFAFPSFRRTSSLPPDVKAVVMSYNTAP